MAPTHFMRILKQIFNCLPYRLQFAVKAAKYHREIKAELFRSPEKEFYFLCRVIQEGDWVLDVGANIGHYTLEMARLCGDVGRVIAFEPVPETFAYLVSNIRFGGFSNVTALNVGCSDVTNMFGVLIPQWESGGDNLYQAHFVDEDKSSLLALAVAIDNLQLPGVIRLVKIDAEGHDLNVLYGMKNMLDRDHPIIIIECHAKEVRSFMHARGYSCTSHDGSPNLIFQFPSSSLGT